MSGRGGAASFGDVTGEYLALRREAAFVTGWHEVVWVRGPDAVAFLDGLVSQSVSPLSPGAVAPSLLLAPQGKLRAPHHLLAGDAEVGLVVDAGVGEAAAGDLGRFKIRVDVSIEPEPRPVIDVWGPRAPVAVGEALEVDVPAGGWKDIAGDLVVNLPFPHGAPPRVVVIGDVAARLAAAGVPRAGRLAADAVRIEAGEPIMGVDVDEATIPQEAGLVAAAVDFTKGCYLGQELVARIDSRGHVNRHLRGVELHVNVLPPAGAQITVGDDAAVGTVTSVAESLELRAPVAMALVRREVEPGAPVVVRWKGGEAAATVRELPLAVE